MKKHYVLKNRKKLFNFVIVLSIILCSILFVSNSYGYEVRQYENIEIKSGDTLWDIAKQYCKKGDVRKYIHEIREISGLENSDIFAGEEIKIPVQE